MLKPSGGVLKKAFGGAAGGFVGKKPTPAISSSAGKTIGKAGSVLAGKFNRPLPSGTRFGTAGNKTGSAVKRGGSILKRAFGA